MKAFFLFALHLVRNPDPSILALDTGRNQAPCANSSPCPDLAESSRKPSEISSLYLLYHQYLSRLAAFFLAQNGDTG
jgi:hypothetical protein